MALVGGLFLVDLIHDDVVNLNVNGEHLSINSVSADDFPDFELFILLC